MRENKISDSIIEPLYEKIYNESLEREQLFRVEEARKLSELFSDTDDDAPPKLCPGCGKPAGVRRRLVERSITTKYGDIVYRRHYYYCGECDLGFYPRDIELGIAEQSATNDVVDWAMDLTVNDAYSRSAERMELHHSLVFSATRIKHLFEKEIASLSDPAEPVPAVPLPLKPENRHRPATVMNDGSMIRFIEGWGEAKLMSVGTLDEKERVYLAEAQSKERFEKLLVNSVGYEELEKRTVLWIADGATFNWNLQQLVCPHADCLLDYWHAIEHVYDCAKMLFGAENECVGLFADRAGFLLLESKSKQLIKELKECLLLICGKGARMHRKAIEALIKYISNQSDRLDYKRFLRNGWPIGSGEIESAHGWVLQKRMKQPGMKWSKINAQRMATARALYASVGPKLFMNQVRLARAA